MLRVIVNDVQHLRRLSLEVDVAANKITCVVGKNGVGKTTLVRALRNLSQSDTFVSTAGSGIFRESSSIRYELDGLVVRFTYDPAIRTLNCKEQIPEQLRSLCAVELPMPHGNRFNFFRSISDVDLEIRQQIILEEYVRPLELIAFLADIYSSDKYESLVETKVRGRSYYCILLSDRYVREDYLSSGEYFLINLYRTIRGDARLVVVDEIDLSLDAAAQVHLIRKLREFCDLYSCSVLFTTHSLAMMRMLTADELVYMDAVDDEVRLVPASYGYVKSLLFGFSGWDRYILTEDPVLQGFLEMVIARYCDQIFFRYKIIHAGGGSQVVNLLQRNRAEGFLANAEQVIAVLDGDERDKPHAQDPDVYWLPIESVEKALHEHYQQSSFPYRLAPGKGFNGAKDLFKSLQRDQVASVAQIYEFLCVQHEAGLAALVGVLNEFLTHSGVQSDNRQS